MLWTALACAALSASCGGSSNTEGDAGDAGGEPADDAGVDPRPDGGDPAPDVAIEPGDPPSDTAHVDGGEDPPGDDAGEIDALERGECTSSVECGGRPCVRVPDEPGGYWLCLVPERDEAVECTSTDPWVDQCCSSFECISGVNGGCFYSDWGWGFCGGAIMPHNTCVYDACSDASDCTSGPNAICVPRDVQDWPRRRCAYGTCRTSLDCVREPGGFCAPIFDYCCSWRISGFYCIYPGSCQYHGDCPGELNGCLGDLSTGGTRCDIIACPM
jgi:hypothetical protein